jgi:hypothetical protein
MEQPGQGAALADHRHLVGPPRLDAARGAEDARAGDAGRQFGCDARGLGEVAEQHCRGLGLAVLVAKRPGVAGVMQAGTFAVPAMTTRPSWRAPIRPKGPRTGPETGVSRPTRSPAARSAARGSRRTAREFHVTRLQEVVSAGRAHSRLRIVKTSF